MVGLPKPYNETQRWRETKLVREAALKDYPERGQRASYIVKQEAKAVKRGTERRPLVSGCSPATCFLPADAPRGNVAGFHAPRSES